MMRTITRTATGLGILVLVALASVTAFVPTGVCDERGCVDECGDGEVPVDAMGGGGEATASTADGLFRTYDANRDLIESENEMINHRMMWLLTIQGLLFASFFLVWRGKKIGDEDGEIRAKEIYTIYALGVFSAVSVGIVLFFGLNTIKCIVESTPVAGTQYVIGLSHGPVPPWVHYLLPWNSLPVLFVVAWHLLVEAETGQPISRPSSLDTSPDAGSGDAGQTDSPS